MDIFVNKDSLKLSNDRWLCLLNVSKLLNIVKIPDIQRNLDESHVDEIYNSQIEQYNKKGYYDFGIISISHVKSDNSYWIIDGQHRYSALLKFFKNDDDFKIFVSLYSVDNNNERDEIYHTINLNKPTAIAKNSNTDLCISKFLKTFEKKYSDYIKKSKSPHRPNFNIDVLREKIIEYDIVDRFNFDDFETKFMDELSKLNTFYSNVSCKQFREWGINDFNKYRDKCVEKKHELLLGIYNQYEWLDRIIDKICDNKQYDNNQHYIKNKRFAIPNELRIKCWEKYNKELNGRCFVCNNNLRYSDMHAGHIKPVYFGGKNTIDNLQPICLGCNLSMGIQNLYDYKKKFYD